MRLAIFDFDGTIYEGETLRLFLRVLARRDERLRRRVRRFFVLQAPAYLAYKAGLWRTSVMNLAMRGLVKMLKGMDQASLEAFFLDCAAEAEPRFNPAALARLRAHRAAGDLVLILSGAFRPFLAAVALKIGADACLGTEILLRDGRCAGMGAHCIGRRKAEALREYLREQEQAGASYDLAQASAYADGARDLPILLMVGRPVAVNPDRGLRRAADERAWEVISS